MVDLLHEVAHDFTHKTIIIARQIINDMAQKQNCVRKTCTRAKNAYLHRHLHGSTLFCLHGFYLLLDPMYCLKRLELNKKKKEKKRNVPITNIIHRIN